MAIAESLTMAMRISGLLGRGVDHVFRASALPTRSCTACSSVSSWKLPLVR
jgi:hypothetical protein